MANKIKEMFTKAKSYVKNKTIKYEHKMKEKRDEKLVNKLKEKERISIHKEMIKKEKLSVNENKVAPIDSFISLQHVNKIYDNHVQAVYDFNLEIKEHDFIVLVGPSGCGKSTTLRMIAGLEDITSGDLYINGNYSNYIQAKDRDIAMVFQSYALYPHLTVYENMAFGLKLRHISKEEINKRIEHVSKILQLNEYLNRKPNALSGGQCQRVALGRAIVRDSKIFLMDEPLSNLDAKLRVSMRSEIIKLHETLNATTIYVTHDQTEAMTMATKIVVMNNGYIQQIGTPQEIFNHPANLFVATFIGSPSMNVLNVNYKNNKVILGNDFELDLSSEEIHKVKDFYEQGLIETQYKLNENEKNKTDKNELLNKINILKLNLKDTKVDEKENIGMNLKIKELTTQIELIDKANIKRTELINIVNEYKKIIENHYETSLFLGIRPDDIIETDEINHNVLPSKEMELKVDVSELLGNQYYVHSFIGNESFVFCMSAYKDIDKNRQIKIVFNLNKIHLFDRVTNKIIL